MSKKAEIELNPPAADGDESQETGTPGGNSNPAAEGTKKALEGMFDAMVPLSGKKSRKNGSDDDSSDEDKPRRRRGGRAAKNRQTQAEEDPKATTCTGQGGCLWFASRCPIHICVLERWNKKNRTRKTSRKPSEGFNLRAYCFWNISHDLISKNHFWPRIKTLANKARDASQTLHALAGNEAGYLGCDAAKFVIAPWYMTFLTETISIARAPWDVPFWGQHVIYYSVIFFVDLAAVAYIRLCGQSAWASSRISVEWLRSWPLRYISNSQNWKCSHHMKLSFLRLENKFAAGSTAPDVLDIYNKKRSTIEASHVDHPQRRFIVEGFIHKTPSGVSALFTCIGILKS